MTFTSWLNRPFLLVQKTRSKLLLVLSFGIFVCLFLFIFRPFGASLQIQQGKGHYLLGFGLNVSLALAINYFILPQLFKAIFNPNNWKVKKEILYLFWSVVLIAIFNYVYNSMVGKGIAPYRSFVEFFGITASIGILPIIILIFIVERNQSKKYTAEAERLNKSISIEKTTMESSLVTITADTIRTKPLELKIDDFLFATADNNYTTLYFLKEGNISNKLLRLTLKNLEAQMADFKSIVRCHRSYLVNKKKIIKIHGNARSLELEIEGYMDRLPVSRSLQKDALI